jgi:uncharacterized repeat protein (TIGR03803 family)/parallel beta-helix repeat protein
MKHITPVAIACLLTSTCFSSVIHVPAEQPTIQAGINAASNGDTVLVAPGTYTENINFMGKAIVVESSNGPKSTIIDGNGAAPSATFSSGEGIKSVLEGFTLTNGAGSGVAVSNSSAPTITKNVITGNVASSGGGIDSNFSSPVITYNTIENNKASTGGGIYVGGASSPGATITNNIIDSNRAYEFGGGITFFAAGTAHVEDNTIANNSCSGCQGGGIYMVNEADEVIVQNLIYSNVAGSGSQIYSLVPQSTTGFRLVNNTVVSTTPATDTAVMADGFNKNAVIVNNIIVAAGDEVGLLCNPIYKYGPPTVEYNDAVSPQGAGYGDSCSGFAGTNGNISARPVFFSNTNFRLQPGSPAINTGTISAPDLPARDFLNDPRIVNKTIDMGAYESPAQVFKTLINFDESDGAYPAYMVQARDGNLWGTTPGKGSTYCGTAFKMSLTGVLTTALKFGCNPDYPDGNEPQGLIQGTDGNFYGVTFFGGSNQEGSVFRLTPEGVLTTLVSFNGANGSEPVGVLTEGTDGNFYGATYGGGDQYSYGTVFKVAPTGKLTTLYQFDFTHGAQPYAGVIQATDGSFYGTAYRGGAWGQGTVYKITSQGTLTVVYSFGEHAYDPNSPVTPLLQGKDGNFYGTTPYGGNTNNYGAVFKLTPSGAFTTLYAFSGPDGYSAGGPLVQATDGNFYGTTAYNTTGQGTVFKITPSGTLTTLHIFDGTDGEMPVAILQDTNGEFYGTTNLGGSSNLGTAFNLDSGLGPFVKTNPTSGKVATEVVILGNNMNGATSVAFNGTAATFKVVSSTEITTTVPTGATTGTVTVTIPNGTLKSSLEFRVTR